MSFENVSHNENNGEYEFARARRVLFDSRISILEASNILADASGNSVHWYIDRNPDYNIVTNLNRPTVGHKRHSIDIICKNIEISEEEQNFILQFFLSSGSLKEMALQMGNSYPTVRNKLDDIIQKITVLKLKS